MNDSVLIELINPLIEANPYDDRFRQLNTEQINALAHKKIVAEPYTRQSLFSNMATGHVSLFYDYEQPYTADFYQTINDEQKEIVEKLSASESSHQFSIKTASSGIPITLSLSKIMGFWGGEYTGVHVTDLHLNKTDISDFVNRQCLGDFNLFRLGGTAVSQLEMLTYIISTKGKVTFSHSDDADSANYSIVGKKLWLAWDTYEGIENGLQDAEREGSNRPPDFSLEVFASLKSSRWFLVQPGQTLFLPGSLTHMVIALEDYIGISNFNFSLPNALRSLIRWEKHAPLFSLRYSVEHGDEIVSELVDITRKKVEALSNSDTVDQMKWGYDFINQACSEQSKTSQHHATSAPGAHHINDLFKYIQTQSSVQ